MREAGREQGRRGGEERASKQERKGLKQKHSSTAGLSWV